MTAQEGSRDMMTEDVKRRGEPVFFARRILKPGEVEVIVPPPVEFRIERRLMTIEEIERTIIDVECVHQTELLESPLSSPAGLPDAAGEI